MTHGYNTRRAAKLKAAEDSQQPNQQQPEQDNQPPADALHVAVAPPPQEAPADAREAEIAAMLMRIQELYPEADRISITTSATGEGVNVRWNYVAEDADADAGSSSIASSSTASSLTAVSRSSASTSSSESSYAPSEMSRASSGSSNSSSSLSSLSDNEQLPQLNNTLLVTPRQMGAYEPGTVARTPKKALRGHSLHRSPNQPINWNATHSSDESRRRQVPPHAQPRSQNHPLRRHVNTIMGDTLPDIPSAQLGQNRRIIVQKDVVDETERKRKDLEDRRIYHVKMTRLEAQSRIHERNRRAAEEAGLLDGDFVQVEHAEMEVDQQPAAGPSNTHHTTAINHDDLSLHPSFRESRESSMSLEGNSTWSVTEMTSEVLLEFPSHNLRRASARFYRDRNGQWRLEGALQTEVLTHICRNHEQMMDSAFRLNCQQWRHLQREHLQPGNGSSNAVGVPAIARVTAPLSEEDIVAMETRGRHVSPEPQPQASGHRQRRGAVAQPLVRSDTEPLESGAGPSRVRREDTEIISEREESCGIIFPVTRRVR